MSSESWAILWIILRSYSINITGQSICSDNTRQRRESSDFKDRTKPLNFFKVASRESKICFRARMFFERFIFSTSLSCFRDRSERHVEFRALNGTGGCGARNPGRTGRKGCRGGEESKREDGRANAAFQYWRQPATLPQRRDVSRLVSGTLIPPAGSRKRARIWCAPNRRCTQIFCTARFLLRYVQST